MNPESILKALTSLLTLIKENPIAEKAFMCLFWGFLAFIGFFVFNPIIKFIIGRNDKRKCIQCVKDATSIITRCSTFLELLNSRLLSR